jgi:hypothetical protein
MSGKKAEGLRTGPPKPRTLALTPKLPCRTACRSMLLRPLTDLSSVSILRSQLSEGT